VTATAENLNPKLNAVYSFTGSGATVSGATATVATGTLVAGPYTVNCGVKEGKAGSEGLKPWESATATANFAVKAFEPPTVSCAASPSDIKPGDTSTVTASGISPQNRPLTYTYSSTTGSISGSGATAAFSSGDAPAGVVTITCNATDDKNQTATATTSLTITAPYVAPVENPEIKQLESRLALHSVFFQTDVPRIAKTGAGLLASQEATLTTLAADFTRYLTFKPDAQLTLTGHADVRGSVPYNQALAERRVVRTKQFLVEQGVPEAKIDTVDDGKGDNLTADQVNVLIEQNPDLDAAQREKALNELGIIVWAQNRRVDITLSNAGDKSQQSVRLYPFNATDSLTLLDEKNLQPTHKAVHATKK
jgi:outer membrane protein OmpA-like peptidoglycan-associated protein